MTTFISPKHFFFRPRKMARGFSGYRRHDSSPQQHTNLERDGLLVPASPIRSSSRSGISKTARLQARIPMQSFNTSDSGLQSPCLQAKIQRSLRSLQMVQNFHSH
ncbi:no significant blast hit [Histoplasma capsulatum G186AR]|uniref:Uncharacterized protein n=1 Tax=Ajellomyces capsulatus TaxID=5037 RepID=A0A8H7YL77_AJECA|nr:hypothetical protein I7I52_04553 [Histoplasma capsulatum]QSS74737.1 no significant blast hit [Histoplasma capsulatum G186AR]